jgi:hypothetical protein
LVALFFAVDSSSPSTSAVYCHSPAVHVDPRTAQFATFPVVAQYTPPPFDSRILLQCGVFSYHPTPSEPLTAGPVSDELGPVKPDHGMNLVCFTIEAKMKPILKRQLDELGVNRKSLFPDLEGLSEFVNWGTRRAGKSNK